MLKASDCLTCTGVGVLQTRILGYKGTRLRPTTTKCISVSQCVRGWEPTTHALPLENEDILCSEMGPPALGKANLQIHQGQLSTFRAGVPA